MAAQGGREELVESLALGRQFEAALGLPAEHGRQVGGDGAETGLDGGRRRSQDAGPCVNGPLGGEEVRPHRSVGNRRNRRVDDGDQVRSTRLGRLSQRQDTRRLDCQRRGREPVQRLDRPGSDAQKGMIEDAKPRQTSPLGLRLPNDGPSRGLHERQLIVRSSVEGSEHGNHPPPP